MDTNDRTYRRNSLRYPGYDYSQPGAVFVTFRTYKHQQLFGVVAGGEVVLTPAGQFTHDSWRRLPERFPDILLDEFIIMPDHIHAIIFTGSSPHHEDSANTVGFVLKSFKNVITSAWRQGISSGWPRYDETIWHRDYHDRIIRTDLEIQAIREYILGNPARWEEKRRG